MPIPGSVRLAMPAETVDIARLQRKSWSRQPGVVTALAATPADQAVRTWREAIVKPPLVHYWVLVALSRRRVAGFMVTGPSNDPNTGVTDSMAAEFVTDTDVPDDHTSRLVNAVVDTLYVDGYETVTWWVRNDDDAPRGFLIERGQAADGAYRGLGTKNGAGTVKQVRLMIRITDQGPATDTG